MKINEDKLSEKFTPEGIMTNMAYTAAFAAERLMIVLDRYLRRKGEHLRHDKKHNFTMLRRSLQAARRYYDLAFDEDLINAVTHSGEMQDYDRAHEDANEVARLLLLYADRCGYDQRNYEELFRTLRGMDGLGKITEEVLEDFYMKK